MDWLVEKIGAPVGVTNWKSGTKLGAWMVDKWIVKYLGPDFGAWDCVRVKSIGKREGFMLVEAVYDELASDEMAYSLRFFSADTL